MLRFFPLLLLTACGLPTDFHPAKAYKGKEMPAYEGEVQVLEKFPAAYEMLGRVSAGGYLTTSDESIMDALKDKAAEHGANAVVAEDGIENSGFSSFSMVGTYSAPKRVEGMAIRVK